MEKTNIFDAEWNDILESLKERNHSFKEMDYFIKLAKQRMQDIALLKSRSEIILLGFDFPEEIVRAFGKAPCYLLGGSFTSAQKAEDMVPRDTDSAIKSIMGMLDIKKEQTKDTSLILLPIVSDSMRKVAGLLKEKCKIIPFEVPNDKTDTLQRIRFTDEIFRVTGEIEKYLHRPLSGKKLSEQIELSCKSSKVWEDFSDACASSSVSVSGSAKMFIAETYLWCRDKKEWMEHLERLTEEIRCKSKKQFEETAHLHVMLFGSPIYAPNYKVPFLIEEMGMELKFNVHPCIRHLNFSDVPSKNKAGMLRELTKQYLERDMSTAFIENMSISKEIEDILGESEADGIIVHILKGQIEYDFELNRIEKDIEKYEQPIFRLETDYNYQDVEQLRIRLEAFSEMLRHRYAMRKREIKYVKKAI